MKKSFFFKSSLVAVAALFMTACNENYDNPVGVEELYDLDVTELVATDGWGGGWCATQYAPAVKTADGRVSQMMENYQGNVDATGVILQQTLEGLKNGNYKVELYANAFYTDGRGFESDMQDGAMDVAYVFANEVKCPIVGQIATATNKNGEYALEVKVTDGTLTLGLGKEKAGTNWHTIQIKSLVLENGTNVKPEAPKESNDVDCTASIATDGWGQAGFAGTWAAPEVATADGRFSQMAEKYHEDVNATGIEMQQIIEVENGKYVVELYANSFYTDGRGFESDMEDGATDVAYVFANEVKAPITAKIATSTTQNGIYTLEVEVTNGTLTLGLGKDKPGTNWHTIQIKSLTLKK